MERVQSASLRLANRTADRLERLWAVHLDGRLSLTEFRQLAAAAVVQANQAGVQLVDMGLAAEVTRQLGRPTSPLGLAPTPVQTDTVRVTRDIDRIIESTPDTIEPDELPASRSRRLASWSRSEPFLTVATATQTGMKRRGAEGWTRRLDADPCPTCVGWADGVVRPPTARMARHNGCSCIQQPVFT